MSDPYAGIATADPYAEIAAPAGGASKKKKVSRSTSGWWGEAQTEQNAKQRQNTSKGWGETLLESGKATLATIAKGAVSAPDMLMEGGRLAGKALTNIGAFVASGGGALQNSDPGQARAIEDWRRESNAFDDRVPTMADRIDQVSGNARMATKAGEFAAGMLGGALVPLPGAKTPSRAPVRPPRLVPRPAPSRASELVAQGERAQIPVMTTDVFPPKTVWGKSARKLGEIIPITGTSSRRVAQQAARVNAVRDIVTEAGATSPVIADVASDLAATRAARLSSLTSKRDSVISSIPGRVPTDRTITAIDKQIARMDAIGTAAAQQVSAKLKDWRAAIQGKDLETLNGIRKEMGDAFKGDGLANIRSTGEDALRQIYGPMRAEMGTFIRSRGGPDAFRQWDAATTEMAGMAGELKNSAFKRVLNNAETTPENVANLLFSQKPSDVQRLFGNLSRKGQDRARAAVLYKALDKAGGIDAISPDKFANEIDRLGASVGVAFKGDDLARIEGLNRVIQITKRAAQAGVQPENGAQLLPWAVPSVLTGLFGPVGGLSVAGLSGALARAYESSPVRDAFIRLGRAKPGTPAYEVSAQRAMGALAGVLGQSRELRDSVAKAANENFTASVAADQPGEQQE